MKEGGPDRRNLLKAALGAAIGSSMPESTQTEAADRRLDSGETDKILIEIEGHAREYISMMEKLEAIKNNDSLDALQRGLSANIMDSALAHLDAMSRLRSRLPHRPKSIK